MFFLPLLAGLAAGAGKYAIEKGEANAQRRRAAEANRYSPWTGHQVEMPKDPSLASSLMGGAGMGLSLGTSNPSLFSWGEAKDIADGVKNLGGAEMAKDLGEVGQSTMKNVAQDVGIGMPTAPVSTAYASSPSRYGLGSWSFNRPF